MFFPHLSFSLIPIHLEIMELIILLQFIEHRLFIFLTLIYLLNFVKVQLFLIIYLKLK